MPLQHTLNAVCGIYWGHGMQPWQAFHCCYQGVTGYWNNFASRQHIWQLVVGFYQGFQKG